MIDFLSFLFHIITPKSLRSTQFFMVGETPFFMVEETVFSIQVAYIENYEEKDKSIKKIFKI